MIALTTSLVGDDRVRPRARVVDHDDGPQVRLEVRAGDHTISITMTRVSAEQACDELATALETIDQTGVQLTIPAVPATRECAA